MKTCNKLSIFTRSLLLISLCVRLTCINKSVQFLNARMRTTASIFFAGSDTLRISERSLHRWKLESLGYRVCRKNLRSEVQPFTVPACNRQIDRQTDTE